MDIHYCLSSLARRFLVSMIKRCLGKAVGGKHEQLITLLAEIEAVLNS